MQTRSEERVPQLPRYCRVVQYRVSVVQALHEAFDMYVSKYLLYSGDLGHWVGAVSSLSPDSEIKILGIIRSTEAALSAACGCHSCRGVKPINTAGKC